MTETAHAPVTVGEVARLKPDSDYVRCYRQYCRVTGKPFDPDYPFRKIPGLLLKSATQYALAVAFADVLTGSDLWSVTPEQAHTIAERKIT